jgi:NAD(P)-dependent dehydrogenase (short-subunit alcohol dehydrogenase family)
LRADVASPVDWDRVFETVLAETGRIDILVNNAGSGVRIAHVTDTTDREIEESIAVNLTGAIFGQRRPMMSGSGAAPSSMFQRLPKPGWPGWSTYSAAQVRSFATSTRAAEMVALRGAIWGPRVSWMRPASSRSQPSWPINASSRKTSVTWW